MCYQYHKGTGAGKGQLATSSEKSAVTTTQELIISTLATSDAVARLLIEKGLITEDEFFHRLWQGRVTYERLLERDPE